MKDKVTQCLTCPATDEVVVRMRVLGYLFVLVRATGPGWHVLPGDGDDSSRVEAQVANRVLYLRRSQVEHVLV